MTKNQSAIKQILNKKSSKAYIAVIEKITKGMRTDHAHVQDAMRIALSMEPIDLALIEIELPSKVGAHSPYVIACASEWLMFEVCYLHSVTGDPPHDQAQEFGLNEKDIIEYKQKWQNIGIDPQLFKYE